MLPRNHEKLSQKESQQLGLPDGFKLYSNFPFGGMNLSASRVAIGDQESFICENFIKIGDGNLRTIYDCGPAIYGVPEGKTIVFFFWFNIGATYYCAVFLNDGTAIQVDVNGNTVSMSSIPGTFYKGAQLPACSQWGSQYLLIVNNFSTNDYWIWDGKTLFTHGGLGPSVNLTDSGANYSTAPTVTAFGGSGSGTAFTATVANGAVVAVNVVNPGSGYAGSDVVQLIFSGGGSDNSAELQAVLSLGNVESIIITDGGSGYTSPVVAITGGGGAGATATAVQTGGVVTSITITNSGSGYTSTPTVAITDGGGGVGATGVAVLGPANVASVTIINGGSGFTSTPSITFQGGGGTGATATATLTSGVITHVTITAHGTGYTSTPAVVVGTGVNNAAAGFASLMPFGVSGSSIETFQQRVWIPFPNQTGNNENGGTFLVSAPGSFTDFATSDGGVTFTSSDSFLRSQITNIKQSNGYLYPIGDSSVNVVSNVQTSGSPSTTTFNNQNTDPQIGTAWRDSVASYSRTILMANQFGIYGLYGGAVTKVSEKLDDLFNNAVFPPTAGALTPCAAVANIFSKKVYLLLMTIKDPLTFEIRNVMAMWDEKEWVLASQSTGLIFINTQEINSNLQAWGTDGTTLFPLFNSPSVNLSKRLSSKLYGAQQAYVQKLALVFYAQGQDMSSGQQGITMNVNIDTNFKNPDTGLQSYPIPNSPISWTAPLGTFPLWASTSGDVYSMNLGFTVTTNSEDVVVSYFALAYADQEGVLGLAGG